MAQNSTGTANSVNPGSGGASAPSSAGSATLKGGGIYPNGGDVTCMTSDPVTYRTSSNFATETLKQAS